MPAPARVRLTVVVAGAGRVVSRPVGISCPSVCHAIFLRNSVVSLASIPAATARFAHWSGGCAGAATCRLRLTSATTIVATFGPKLRATPIRVPRYAKPTFALSTDFSDMGGVASVDAADFNGDGYVDILITRHNRPTMDTYPLLMLLNNRHGGFYDGTSQIFEGAVPRVQWPRKVVIADFNNDGRPDIFIADTGYDHSPGPGFRNTLALSTPDGKLRDATSQLPAQIRFTHSATAADVNGDGSLDLYIGSIYTESHKEPPEILLNDGTGHFRVCTDCLPPLVTSPVAVGGSIQDGPTYTASQFVDVNGDGAPDLVLAGQGFYRVPEGVVSSDSQVLVNDGSGHFSVSTDALPPRPWNNTATGLDVRTADLNHDGHSDLLIAYTQTDPAYVGAWVQVLINNGNGTFRDETQTRLPQTDNQSLWPNLLDLADLNGDGAPDLIVDLVEGGKQPTPFYLNDGNGNFTPLPTGYANTINNDFALVDVNGNGHRDLFTTDDYGFPKINDYIVRELGGPEPPAPPSGVRAVHDPATGSLVISWSYDWGAAQYEIYRSLTPGTTGTKLATTRLMRFVDPHPSAGPAYYTVRAANAAGDSGFSTAATAH
jgi:FG-GAP-like repeat